MQLNTLLSSFVLHFLLSLAGALSLVDFQILPIQVPVPCQIAYQRTIPNCKTSDFTNGAPCSSECATGLGQIAQTVNANCGQVGAPKNSLLAEVFQNNLVSVVCASVSKPTKQTTAVQASTKAAPPSISSASRAATSPLSAPSSPTSSPSIAASGSSSSDSTSPTQSPTPAAALASSSQSASSTSSTSNAAASPAAAKKLTMQQQQILAIQHTGGGSPFDIIDFPSNGNRLSQNSLALVVFVWAWMILLR